jgi:RNA polymerase sigma factor (sigma-70 family)
VNSGRVVLDKRPHFHADGAPSGHSHIYIFPHSLSSSPPTIHPKFFQARATFSSFAILYLKPLPLPLTAVIPSVEMLVQQCIDGDTASYRLLYDRYAKAMFNTSLRIVNSQADAEDILQEAFTDAFRQLKDFEGRSTFGAWLKQIVVYKSIALLKKQKIQFTKMDDSHDVAESNEDPDAIWYTVDTIKASLQELPDGYRTVLSLHLLEGYDQEEIAEILGVARSTVRTQYMRAKQRLIELLKKREVYER